MNKRICVIIPVYNESKVICDVIDGIHKAGDYISIVVDDGSSDDTTNQARKNGMLVIRHKINRGKGAAVKTGVMVANLLDADVIVTMDGDGQHAPEDLELLIRPIISGEFDVVLGSRLLDRDEMPFVKVIANSIGNFFTWIFYGILVSDSQSGFRAYSQYAALIIDTKADKYEYDSKVIREIKNNRLRFTEIPVRTLYTDYSMGKKNKQGFVNGLVTLFRMVWKMIA